MFTVLGAKEDRLSKFLLITFYSDFRGFTLNALHKISLFKSCAYEGNMKHKSSFICSEGIVLLTVRYN